MLSVTDVTNALNRVGMAAFGIGMPILSPQWTKHAETVGDRLRVNDTELSLTLDPDLPAPPDNSWLCPVAGVLRKVDEASSEADFSKLGVTLLHANGTPIRQRGMVLTLFPQAYLRLRRLYAHLLERTPARLDQPIRPVPRYFFYTGNPGTTAKAGNVNPGDALDILGTLTIHDDNGMPIDPLAVAATFYHFIRQYSILQPSANLSLPDPEASQLKRIAEQSGTAATRLWLSHHSGQPYINSDNHLQGMTAVAGAAGLFTLNADAARTITLAAASAEFPAEARRLLVLGASTYGPLSDRVELPALPDGVTLLRDFLSLRVVELQPFLIGNPNRSFLSADLEIAPTIHIHEPLQLLADGNEVLAATYQAISTHDESLCVGQVISGDFTMPTEPGTQAHFPQFPSPADGADDPEGLPINLRDRFNPVAAFIDDGDDTTLNVDVNLILENLPINATVRVYPRQFDLTTADETRGDGAGGIVAADGRLTLRLRDPFSIRRLGISDPRTFVPDLTTLSFDVVIVKRNGKSRIYGNISTPVVAPAPALPPSTGSNLLTTATRRSICNAGILGTGAQIPDPPDTAIAAALALTQEPTASNPNRDASRLPTMARRDLLVAGRRDRQWQSVLSAGRLTSEMISAQQRLGNPGSLGGRETQHIGVTSQGGRLAYEMGRMALRRVTNLGDRLPILANANWAMPPALAPTDVSAGSFSGAILQTIAPRCETPGLHLLKEHSTNLDEMPTQYEELRPWLQQQLDAITPESTPGRSQINDLITALNNLGETLTDEVKQKLTTEIRREIITACYGRRDTQWALQNAIANARRFIYIETPGIAATQIGTAQPFSVDLFAALTDRLTQTPGLHVMICTPKLPDFPQADRVYQRMSNWEVGDRQRAIQALPTFTDAANPRVVAFHPLGFPGRFSRLEGTVVIVDDVWALVGSSSLRRRGLTFDGGSDLVLTDTVLEGGRCAQIADFRRRLLSQRLGIEGSSSNAFGKMPNANFVRLEDGVEAFYVILESLRAGGFGKIAPLWNEIAPDAQTIPPDLSNPEGQEFIWSSELRSRLTTDPLAPSAWLY
jgi:hypothetical protein